MDSIEPSAIHSDLIIDSITLKLMSLSNPPRQ